MTRTDLALGATGLAIAALAAAFPWHVHANRADFTPPTIAQERPLKIDEEPLITGSITRPPRILFVSRTHALAQLPGTAEGDYTILRIGSPLGGDRVSKFVRKNESWTVITSKGRRLPVELR